MKQEYFTWLISLIDEGEKSENISYKKLLRHMHDTPFRYSIPRDENRAEEGLELRRRFSDDCSTLTGPCSVLEMMVALAIHCEDGIMEDASIGNRTGQWFWGMVVNLGLGPMTDNRYDKECVDKILEKFLNREYEADGRGGLFTIKDCEKDLRTVEIWYQLLWYLNSIV